MTDTAYVPPVSTPAPSLRVKDPGSALTHFIGIVAALSSAPFLLMHFRACGADALAMTGAIVFLLSMVLLYTASTVYHTIITDRLIFKKIDHMMVCVLIAGTYTPICLTVLRDGCGYYLLAGVWGFALAGALFKLFWVTCPKWVSSVLYIGMGWLCVFALPQIITGLSPAGFGFLLAGGILYTVGGIIYALKLPIFNSLHPCFGSHEIFHVFVLAGNLLQFITVYQYLL